MFLQGHTPLPPSGTLTLPEPWFTYLLKCADGSLYCGVTNNLARRIARHNSGTASRYTAARLPVRLLLAVVFPGKIPAMRAEALVKKTRRGVNKCENLLQLAADQY